MDHNNSCDADLMGSTPLTRTKILLPRRPADLLTRQRLFELLDDLLDYRLALVIAPAGYGKTCFLIDLAYQLELPTCWYALDSLDQDPQRFAAHFIASIAQHFPEFGRRSAAALHGATSTAVDLDRLVRIIANDAYEHIREHFVIVLDDYHLVGESETISHFVNQFIQTVDENCHLILSSRTLLSLHDLPLMVARSQVCGLGFEELAFHADEIQTLVLQNYHLTLPGSAADELVKETEGWITGLLLSAKTMWRGMADRARVARVSRVGLYDYLAQQVLEQQPASVRDFLLCTSLLEEFDAELCEAVLGPVEDWQGLIDTVLRSNLFVVPLENGTTWIRYHHLFQEFLQAQLAQERPDDRDRILQRQASVYTEREQWEKAYAVYRRLADVASTADLIEQAGSSLVKSGRLATLAQWIDALPADVLAERPGLLSLRGVAALVQGDVQRALSLQSRAEAAFRAAGDLPQLTRALVWRAAVYRFIGNYRASLADADEALALTEGNASSRAVQAEALRNKAMSLYWLGQLHESIECLEQSLAVHSALDDVQTVAMLQLELGLAYVNAGRYAEAFTHYDRSLDHWQKTDNIIWQANLLNNLGVLCHLNGDLERAGGLFGEALACARQVGYARAEAFTLCSIGDLYADLDARDAALDAYRQARQIAGRIEERYALLYVDLAEAALARSKGDMAQARQLLDSARQLGQESGSGFEQGLWQMEAGRIALAEGDALEAVAQLEGSARHFDDGGQRVEGARAHLYLGAAYQALGHEEAALSHLRHAFRLAADLESQYTLIVTGRRVKMLLEAAQSDLPTAHQASRLLVQSVRFEHDIPALRRRLRQHALVVPLGPPMLTIRTLGRAEVTLDGKSVNDPEWRSRKIVQELFFLLLAHPEGLTKEAIGAILWPDSSPTQLKLRFKNTIYRLRRALGQDVILLDENLYGFNRALDYEFDVESFWGRLAQAQAATEPAERAATYREAVRLYRGPYLSEADGTWVWPERERLWRACVDALLKLARFHLEAGENETTLAYCQRVLAQDPCLEEAHRLALRAWAATGNRAAVNRQFERCRQALLEEVNAPPSPQTEALYETLMH